MSGQGKRVLFFSKSSGFEHDTVKRGDAELAPAEVQMIEFGASLGYEVTCTKDGSVFTPAGLADFDIFLFCTTGNLLEAGHDGTTPMPAGGKEALLDAIAAGKGFIGVHNGSDTFHGQDAVDPYIAMLGGEFATHGSQQNARQDLVSSAFPQLAALGESFVSHDEWYVQRNLAADIHVILRQSTDGMTGDAYEGKPAYPATWARQQGQGRVFYISMGHRPDNWEAPQFRLVMQTALDWTAGKFDAEIAPNIADVCPGVPTV